MSNEAMWDKLADQFCGVRSGGALDVTIIGPLGNTRRQFQGSRQFPKHPINQNIVISGPTQLDSR